MKKLGFGCMRLPLTNPEDPTSVDLKQFCEMIDTFMDMDLHILTLLILITKDKVNYLSKKL